MSRLCATASVHLHRANERSEDLAPSACLGVSEQMTTARPNHRHRAHRGFRISNRDFLELRHRVRLTSRTQSRVTPAESSHVTRPEPVTTTKDVPGGIYCNQKATTDATVSGRGICVECEKDDLKSHIYACVQRTPHWYTDALLLQHASCDCFLSIQSLPTLAEKRFQQHMYDVNERESSWKWFFTCEPKSRGIQSGFKSEERHEWLQVPPARNVILMGYHASRHIVGLLSVVRALGRLHSTQG
uniref:Uncharacterized protein n=1 Tax=Anopheles farauti TaxID=69004 RepID=A0A182Q3Q3_9DIPT